MTIEEAMQNLRNIAEAYRGTLQEHKFLQESLELVSRELAIQDKNGMAPIQLVTDDSKKNAES